jgi:ABC-2 type transport system permease protein
VRLYLEIAVRAFRRSSAYRGAAAAGLLTNAFFGAVMTFMYRSVYAAGGTVAGLSLEDCVTYTWLMQSLISVGAAWLTWDVMATIKSGDVVSDLAKPWSFYGYWLSRALGERSFNLLTRGILTYLVGVAAFGARVPAPHAIAAFLVAITLSVLVSFAISFLVNLSAFWLFDAAGLGAMVNTVMMFFSGFLVPLAFLPPAVGAVAAWLPFQAIASLPALIFLEQTRGAAIWQAFATQAGWAVALTAAAVAIGHLAFRKVVIQGG